MLFGWAPAIPLRAGLVLVELIRAGAEEETEEAFHSLHLFSRPSPLLRVLFCRDVQ